MFSENFENPQANYAAQLIQPKGFDEVKTIADHINNQSIVIINFETVIAEKPSDFSRILDFVSGTAFANGAVVNKISATAFIVTPKNVKTSNLIGGNTMFGEFDL